jgi:plastocyanin
MVDLRNSQVTACVLFLAAVQALGCGGDGDGNAPPPSTTIAKAANSGDGQSATVGQTLSNPLQVVVMEDGSPAANAPVTWSTTSADGALSPTSGATDANGITSSSWTLGTLSGSQTAEATLSGASGSPVTFTATAAPDAAATLSDAGGNGQVGAIGSQLADQVQAKVADQFGNGVPGVVVGWTATGATVSAANLPSDAAGISRVNVTLGNIAGPIVITATAGDLTGSPVTFSATAAAAPTTAAVSVVNNSFNPSALTISAGTTVVWTWPSTSRNHNVVPDASLPARSGDPVDGPRTYSFRFDTPGTYAYYCEVHGRPGGLGMSGVITVQ